MNDDTTVNVKINASDTTKDSVASATKGFKGLWQSVAGGQIAAQAAMSAFNHIKSGVTEVLNEAKEYEQTQAQLNAVLKSTGGSAGVTADMANKLAESISKTTPISREAALAGENMLLTFRGLHKDVFPATTRAVTDMATAMNGGAIPSSEQLRNTAILVGKAMNDPAVGLTRLMRVGVTFTDQQKEQIKTLEASGKTTQAQKIILDELAKEFGGSATASAKTFTGAITMLRNQLIDMGVKDLEKLKEALNKIDWDKVIKQLDNFLQSAKNIAVQIINFLEPSFEALWNSVSQKLLPSLENLYNNVLKPLLPVIGVTLVVAFKLAIDAVNTLISVISPLINWMARNKDITYGLIAAITAWYVLMKANDAFTTISNSLTLLSARMAATTAQTGGLRGSIALLNNSLSSFAGWGLFAGAAIAAFLAIENKAKETKQVLDDTMNHVNEDYDSINNATQQLSNLAKHGTPAQQARAKKALAAGYATGTNYAPGGIAMVGEQGPELIYLPRGSQVIPNKQTSQILNQSTSRTVNIQNIILGSADAAKQFFTEIDRDTLLTGKGLTPVRGM